MATLKQEILFFNDEFGRTRPGAKIFTYAAGTTTQKATYTDSDLANANPWPVVADGAGIFPPIYLGTGGYRVVVKDQNDVQLYDRDNLNIADTSVITTSYLVFDNLIDAKLGVLIDGQTASPQVGQAVKTLGLNTSTDGLGAEWIVVAGGTGTADDDLFATLDNGNQIQKLRNQTPWNFDSYTVGGTADAIELTRRAENPINTAYNTGQRYYFTATANNTGAVTIDVDGLGTKSIVHPDATPLVADDIESGQGLIVFYDGTNMVLVSGYSRKEIDDYRPPSISGFNGINATYLIDDTAVATTLGVESGRSVDTWYSVGPTGSGADIIWSALDSITDDSSYIIVRNRVILQWDAAGLSFVIGYGATTTGALTLRALFDFGGTAASSDTNRFSTDSHIPLTTGNTFSVRWAAGGVANTLLAWDMELIGFGI